MDKETLRKEIREEWKSYQKCACKSWKEKCSECPPKETYESWLDTIIDKAYEAGHGVSGYGCNGENPCKHGVNLQNHDYIVKYTTEEIFANIHKLEEYAFILNEEQAKKLGFRAGLFFFVGDVEKIKERYDL